MYFIITPTWARLVGRLPMLAVLTEIFDKLSNLHLSAISNQIQVHVLKGRCRWSVADRPTSMFASRVRICSCAATVPLYVRIRFASSLLSTILISGTTEIEFVSVSLLTGLENPTSSVV